MANCIKCGRQLPGFTFGKKICQWCVQHEAAQRGEDGDDAKQIVLPAPWVRRRESTITLTQVLLGANVAVFVAMALAGSSFEEFSGQILVHFGANFGPLTLSGQWWRLATYMFLHGGVMHIAFNMWCLWDLGALCESLYGRWTFAAIYLITGVGGGVASLGWNPNVLSVGASGAIFGLAGALVASLYLGEFSLPRAVTSGPLRSLLFFIGFNVVLGNFLGGIDNACHIGGLVSGAILGALIAVVAPQQDALPKRAGVVAVGALVVIAGALGVLRWRGGPIGMQRVIASMADGQSDQGLARLQAQVRQQPNSSLAHFALGQAYLNQESFPEAEGEFKRVIELQPKNADAHLFMGLALAAEQNHQVAIQEFKTAADLSPRTRGVYFEMGESYAELKNYDDAIAAYLKEKEINGDHPDLETALAEAYQAKGMTQQAQDANNRAAQLKNSR
jgi:membrane associated rhomboid family serine protease/cytochrome c-type biogenesis protein CcmH/NrfG